MPILIYNSLTKKKEELIPLDGKTIKMYSCGVTVYDKCHIGHARSLYIFDVMRRYLKYRGYQVHFIRNITDVDDKIINKVKELDKPYNAVVDEYIDAYEQDLKNLGVDKADEEPRATQYIPKMIDFIEKLIKKDFAYEVDGDVYYSVRKFKDYGKLSGQSVDQMIEATRIEQDPKKHDPLDFALWKKAKEGEKSWSSPWGEGRPGWHIECSCMSMNELGSDQIDIHAGGRDLIFPHHENEIAQSEALTGKKPFAKYWIHHGLLTINGQKMAKSLGNFITVEDIVNRFEVKDVKRFFLSSHYGSDINFSEKKIKEMHQAMQRVKILIISVNGANATWEESKKSEPLAVEDYKNKYIEAMDDNFNTPKALAVLSELVSAANKELGSDSSREASQFILNVFKEVFDIALVTDDEMKLSVEQSSLVDERRIARKEKDFKRSDELRDLLKKKGIVVEDTKDGQVWRRA